MRARELVVDGRGLTVRGYENGYFLRPTILDGIPPGSTIATTEVFGPVLGLMHVDTVDEAHRSWSTAANTATWPAFSPSSGAAARQVPLRGRGRQHRHQHRRGRADGLLPFQRLEEQLLRHAARPGQACRRVLHADQGRGRALARRMVKTVLAPVPQDRHAKERARWQ